MWSYQRVSYTDMHIHTWSYMSIHWCHSFMNTRNRCIGPKGRCCWGTLHQASTPVIAEGQSVLPSFEVLGTWGRIIPSCDHRMVDWWPFSKPTSVDVGSNPSLKDRLHSVQSSLFGGDMSFFTKERTMVFIKLPGFTSISPWFSHHFTWIWRSQSTFKLSHQKLVAAIHFDGKSRIFRC